MFRSSNRAELPPSSQRALRLFTSAALLLGAAIVDEGGSESVGDVALLSIMNKEQLGSLPAAPQVYLGERLQQDWEVLRTQESRQNPLFPPLSARPSSLLWPGAAFCLPAPRCVLSAAPR